MLRLLADGDRRALSAAELMQQNQKEGNEKLDRAFRNTVRKDKARTLPLLTPGV
jgi:hypothetical protein